MIDSTIKAQAPTPADEIAEIEKAVGVETEEAKQTTETKVEKSAFERLAEKKNFGSADDLAVAYENLESVMNPTRKELSELKEMVKGIQEQNKPVEVDPFADLPKEQRDAMDLLDKLLDRQLNKKLSPLLQKVEVDKASNRIAEVRKQFPEVKDNELNQALVIMKDYPKMSLKDAVKLASYDRATTKAKTNLKRTETSQKNKRAFSESASTARQGDDTDYSKMTMSELEEILNVHKSMRKKY